MDIGHAEILRQVAEKISSTDLPSAKSILRELYAFEPIEKTAYGYNEYDMTRVFVRDGFVDRYKGIRLVYPPALRLISERLPVDFPYHKNWKFSETHFAYWELSATLDHIDPVARSGRETSENWATCSMLTNSIKSSWTLEQLGWSLLPPGDFKVWDGLLGWFVNSVKQDPDLLKLPYFKRWHACAREYV